MVHDLVEGGGDGRKGRELLDQGIAPLQRFPADDGVAVLVEDGTREQVSLVVLEGFLKLDREGVLEEVEHVFARREVDREVVPLGGGDLRDAAFHQRLAGGDELDDGGAPLLEVGLDRADRGRALHRGEQVAEEALLGALEGGHGRGLGVSVAGAFVVLDAGGLERLPDVRWMILKASA